MPKDESLSPPSLQWRSASTATIALVGLACKSFLKIGVKKTETHGLENFIKVLDERQDVEKRERGLLTGEIFSSAFCLCSFLMSLQFRIILLCMYIHGKFEHVQLNCSDIICSLDDPLIWGFLPMRFFFNPTRMRWSLGSYDICFQGRYVTISSIPYTLSDYFKAPQVLSQLFST